MSKLRVAMIGDYPLDPDRIDGGVQAVFSYLVEALREVDDIELTIVKFVRQRPLDAPARNDGVNVRLLPRYRLGATTRYQKERRDLSDCLANIRPHVVHGQGMGMEGFLAVTSGVPNIVTIHGIISEDAKFKSRLQDRMRLRAQSRVTEPVCIGQADNLALISPYLQDYYRSNLTPRVWNIANPVSEKFFTVDRKPEAGRFLFAGKVIPRKGVLDLVNAFATVRETSDCRLVIAGDTNDRQYLEKVETAIREHGIGDSVELPGLLDESQVLEQFARCEALVLPSFQETAPMVIQQAMAAGIPVVATRICGVPYQIDDGRSGMLFEPGQSGDLARILLEIHSSGERRAGLSQHARQHAQNHFAAAIVARETARAYRTIRGDAARRPASGATS